MGKHYTFKVDVDEDVRKRFDIRVPSQIEWYVFMYLSDPDGWGSRGYTFEPSEHNPRVHIRLSMPSTITSICGLSGNLSCAELGGRNMYLNADRWFNGAPNSKLSLDDYRQYMVSHEIGHILGFDHAECPCKNCPAPIMMQQTRGIGQCKPNTKV